MQFWDVLVQTCYCISLKKDCQNSRLWLCWQILWLRCDSWWFLHHNFRFHWWSHICWGLYQNTRFLISGEQDLEARASTVLHFFYQKKKHCLPFGYPACPTTIPILVIIFQWVLQALIIWPVADKLSCSRPKQKRPILRLHRWPE